MTDETKNPAIEVASEIEEGDSIFFLDDGVQVKLTPVPAAVVDAVVAKIAMPEIPVVHLVEQDRDEQNPNDPTYLKEVAAVERKRTEAMIDASVMFGITLVNGMPDTTELISKLKFLEKRGQLSLDGYDLDDPRELEFVYKKFSAPMWMISEVQRLSSVSPEDINKAKRTFRGKKAR